MWTPAARAHHGRDTLPSTTCLSDREWALAEPHLPPPARTGRPRRWPLRRIIDAVLYVLRAGCAWPLLPVGHFPPWRTVYWWFRRLLANGTWDRLSAALVMADRERVGRAPQPTGCVLDSQTAKAGGTGVAGPRGGACPWAGKAGPEGPGQASRRAQTHGAGQHGWTFAPCGGRARRPARHATRGSGAARLAAALALSRPVLDGCGLCWAARCPCHARADRGGGRSITHTRLYGPGTAMGDQAHLRHVRAQPPPRARSRGAARRGRRLDHPRLRRPDAQAARSSLSFQNGT